MQFCLSCLIALLLWLIILPKFLQSFPSTKYEKSLHTSEKWGCVTPDKYKRKPVVMVPGVLGSRIEGKYNKSTAPWLCKKISDWEDLWLNLEYLVPLYVNCWVDNMRMNYNNITRKSTNRPGVVTRVPDFGGTSAFEYLDADTYAPGSKYFAPLVEHLTCILGYTRKKDLMGAPFDWRLAPLQQGAYFKNLTALVEDAYYKNGNRRVVIIGHSLGCLFSYYFLQHKDQSWKDKFIDSLISISGPYLGAVKSLKALTSGETEGFDWVVPKLKVRAVARTNPAFLFLVPRPDMWPKNKRLLVVTLSRNYTVYDYKALFERLKCEWCWEMWKDNGMTLGSFKAPGVPVYCVYSSQVPTPETLVYDEDLFPDDSPSLIDGSGDGTVNIWSASACLRWRTEQPQPIHDVELPGNSHVPILWNATLHKYINGVLVS